jgi:hypothetical protein
MNLPTTKTPMYVLLKDKQPIGPSVVPDRDGTKQRVLFGFSDKGPYDAFIASATEGLRPYPLVKGYLKGLLGEKASSEPVIVIDASSATAPSFHAATVQSVVACMESNVSSIPITLRLDLVPDSGEYQVRECDEMMGTAG